MDPNETLKRLRQLVKLAGRGKPNGFTGSDADYAEHIVTEMAELVIALDEWLSGGGFPPEAWNEGPDAVGARPYVEVCDRCGPEYGKHGIGHAYPGDPYGRTSKLAPGKKDIIQGDEVWNQHSNDLGDWCPWSGTLADDEAEQSCPAMCRGSFVVML